jgi:hypothetical protein
MELGPLRERGAKTKLDPAPVICEATHGSWTWRVYNIGTGYDIYREARPGTCDYPMRRFVRSYRTRFFAKRKCRKGFAS